MSKPITFITYGLLGLWSLCALQANDVATFATFSYFAIVLLLLLEAVALIVIISNIGNLVNSSLNMAVFVWLIYAVLNTIVNSNDLFRSLRTIIWWPLIYFLFYYIAYEDSQESNVRLFLKAFPFLFFLMLLLFVYMRTKTVIRYDEYGKEVFVQSNAIYFNALLLPFAFLSKTKRLKYLLLIIGFILVLISFKRSALIYSVLVLFMSIYYDFVKSKSVNIVAGILLSCAIIAAGVVAFNYINKETNNFILNRFVSMQSDEGSGRLDIYKTVWKKFEDKSLEDKLIGSGQNSVLAASTTVEGTGVSAHNDFLEVLFDFGIVGLIIYLYIILLLIRRLFYLRHIDDRFFQANYAAFLIFIVMSSVSHLIIYPTFFAYLAMIWAMTEGLIKNKERENEQ
ncbi:MAG: O-antigen ligase family protein [Bacteroidota bacterium]|nr:O-antigen ligase family protein [Bacteroidota bacterium]